MAVDAAALGEAAARWTFAQVRRDGAGPWMPESVVPDATPDDQYRDGLYGGVAGLALLLAEIAVVRPLTRDEVALATEVERRLVAASSSAEEPSLYDGLAGYTVALRALGSDDVTAIDRLASSARTDGWLTTIRDFGTEVFHDVVLGTAGVVLGALDVGGTRAHAVVRAGCEALVRAAEPADGGVRWRMTPGHDVDMPNFSHGTAGVATVLALGGAALDREDWVTLAVSGTEHLLTLAEAGDGLFRLPMRIPYKEGYERFAQGWCHGGTGTSVLFPALARAGVEEVGGDAVADLRRRSIRSVLASGVPDRLHPGFWDNDGLCCGTAGVGMMLLDAAQDAGDATWADELLAAARRMGDALGERALPDGDGVCWRFTEHRADEPLLPPGPGWMQGSAGIAAFLLRLGRVEAGGLAAPVVRRPDAWWTVPDRLLVG